MNKKFLIPVLSLSLPLCAQTSAQEEESAFSGQGEVAFEFRQFQSDDKNESIDQGLSMFSRVEVRYENMGMSNVFRFFSRVDQKDNDRSILAIEDAYASYSWGEEEEWKVLAGFQIFNWSQTEAFHPADVVNSRNLDSELENLEKIGEFTFELERKILDGSLNVFFWPRVEDPRFPGIGSRAGAGIDFEKPVFVDGTDKTNNSRYQNQYGLRLTQTFGDSDFSFHYLNHFDRNQFQLGLDSNGNVAPHYFRVTQLGGSFLHTWDAFIFKLEAANRSFEADVGAVLINPVTFQATQNKPIDHNEVAFGIEYILPFDSGEELSFFFEGQTILGTSVEERQTISIFQHDLFFGGRFAFNDVMGTELFTSLIYDLERSGEYIFNVNITRRLTDEWKFKSGYRHYQSEKEGTQGLEVFNGDSYFFFNLNRFF